MSNMSYCRFQNTRLDLRDCKEALDDGEFESLSGEELHAAKRLIAICQEIAIEYGDLIEED